MPKKQKNAAKHPQTSPQDEFYEVEEVMGKRLTEQGMLYLIRWKNYPDAKDYTWEPVSHLTAVYEMIQEFNEKESNKRNKPKMEPQRPIRMPREEEEEKEVEKEEKTRKRTRKQRLPSPEKSDSDHKHTSVNEDEVEEESIQPRKIQPKRVQLKRPLEYEPKKTGKSTKAPKVEKEEFDRFWQKDGCELGRICKHFLEDGKLVFVVNVTKGELVCGIVALRIDEMHAIDPEKLVGYMESWARNHLIEKENMKSQQYKDFESYWRSVD